ncbi:MAG: transposase [Ktedonobacteraceae bacterium]
MVSVDEKPGIQALERDGATLPTKAGKVERREFNYIRHGIQVLTGNIHLATGKLITPTIADTRTEADFVEHIARLVQSDPKAGFVILCDQLTTHKSESLVRSIAKVLGDDQVFGEKGKWGILKSMETRQASLSASQHRIRFVYTPKHCSWLNSIEVWFSIRGQTRPQPGELYLHTRFETKNSTLRPLLQRVSGQSLQVVSREDQGCPDAHRQGETHRAQPMCRRSISGGVVMRGGTSLIRCL